MMSLEMLQSLQDCDVFISCQSKFKTWHCCCERYSFWNGWNTEPSYCTVCNVSFRLVPLVSVRSRFVDSSHSWISMEILIWRANRNHKYSIWIWLRAMQSQFGLALPVLAVFICAGSSKVVLGVLLPPLRSRTKVSFFIADMKCIIQTSRHKLRR